MPPYAAFHLGLHCLPKYLFTGIQNKKDKQYYPKRYIQITKVMEIIYLKIFITHDS